MDGNAFDHPRLDHLAALLVELDLEEVGALDQLLSAVNGIEQDTVLPETIRTMAGRLATTLSETRKQDPKALPALASWLEAQLAQMRQVSAADPAPAAPETAPVPEGESADEEALLELDLDILRDFVAESMEHLQSVESNLLILEQHPDDTETLNAVFRAFHSIKGTASFLQLDAIKRLAHNAEIILDRARKGISPLSADNSDLALKAADMLKEMIENLVGFAGGALPAPPKDLETLLRRLELPAAECPEPKIPAGRTSAPEPGTAIRPGRTVAGSAPEPAANPSPEPACAAATEKKHEPFSDATVRVGVKRLDNLINMVGELLVNQAIITQNKYVRSEQDQDLSKSVQQMNKIGRQLQDLSMSLRMVPLKNTFQKMERLARDLAKTFGKSVRFIVEGEDTEIDRNMVEVVSDPLVHMIRNAIDHGLELPGERRSVGKTETGHLTLHAYHAAGNVVLELQDDGRGLDPVKILNRALDKGWIEPGKDLTEGEIFRLLFLPGFSMADQVTEVSGRGVGLDVVKKNIESLRGHVDIDSVPGRGTTFTIRIPLTLAIIDGMLLKTGDSFYIIPTLNVLKIFRPEPGDVFAVSGKGEMVRLRDDLIAIHRLHQIFRISGAVEDPAKGILLLVENEGKKNTLLADALLGQQQVVIRSLPPGLGDTQGLSGAAVLGDGNIGLIIDISTVLRLDTDVREARRQDALVE